MPKTKTTTVETDETQVEDPTIEAVPTITLFFNRPTGKTVKHPLLNNMESPEVVRIVAKPGVPVMLTPTEVRDALKANPQSLREPGRPVRDFSEGVDAAVAAAAFHGAAAGDAANVTRTANKGKHRLPSSEASQGSLPAGNGVDLDDVEDDDL